MKKEKIKKWINKHDNLVVLFILLFLISMYVFIIELGSTDELWNFGNIYKMYDGGKIYVDNNVIITPLFFVIANLLFYLFGANFLVFRIYNLFIYLSLFFLLYILFKTLKIKKLYAFFYTILMFFFLLYTLSLGANYNIMANLFILIGIITKLKIKNLKVNDCIQGLFIFLIFITKQTVGVYYILGTILYEILIWRGKEGNLKRLLLRGFVSLLLLIGFLVILQINQVLDGFLNYAILGMFEFGGNNLSVDIFLFIGAMIIGIVIVAFLLYLLYGKGKVHLEKKIDTKPAIFMLCLSFFQMFQIYPIVNQYHIICAFIVLAVLVVYILHVTLSDILYDKRYQKLFVLVAIIILIFPLRYIMVNYEFIEYMTKQKRAYSDPYYGIMISEETEKKIQKIQEYILEKQQNGQKVIIFSPDAMLYNTPLRINNGKMDLPFLGNFGYNGEENLIKELGEFDDVIFLLKEDKIYQESDKARQTIVDISNKVGEIEEYSIYEKRND